MQRSCHVGLGKSARPAAVFLKARKDTDGQMTRDARVVWQEPNPRTQELGDTGQQQAFGGFEESGHIDNQPAEEAVWSDGRRSQAQTWRLDWQGQSTIDVTTR